MQTDVGALARRIEQATGPDRALDLAIAKDIGLAPGQAEWGPNGCGYVDRNQWACVNIPVFTASLDAAMLLVPEGWRFIIDKRPWGDHRKDGYRCHVWEAPILAYEDNERWASTPALAMTLAALHATASLRAYRVAAQSTEGNPS